MSVAEKLDEMESRLEQAHTHLGNGEYDEARDAAEGLGDTLDCALCHNLEEGVVAGIVYVAVMSPSGQERRAEQVQEEIGRFLKFDLPAARDQLAELEAGQNPPA